MSESIVKKRVGVYPGSFDPPTLGHIDIACRAAQIVDELIIGVYARPNKNVLFNAEERVQLWYSSLQSVNAPANIRVATFDNLTTEFARSVQAAFLVRGLRTVTDFEVEFQQAHMYRRLAPEIDVILLVTDLPHMFVSASLIKEVAKLGAKVEEFVTLPVAQALQQKIFEPPVS